LLAFAFLKLAILCKDQLLSLLAVQKFWIPEKEEKCKYQCYSWAQKTAAWQFYTAGWFHEVSWRNQKCAKMSWKLFSGNNLAKQTWALVGYSIQYLQFCKLFWEDILVCKGNDYGWFGDLHVICTDISICNFLHRYFLVQLLFIYLYSRKYFRDDLLYYFCSGWNKSYKINERLSKPQSSRSAWLHYGASSPLYVLEVFQKISEDFYRDDKFKLSNRLICTLKCIIN
jgi:hypothetical protein